MKKALLRTALQEALGVPDVVWQGFSAPLGQLLSPSTRDAMQPWPYRTETAEVLWRVVRDLIPKHPELSEPDILKRAVEISGVDPLDLSPEDWRLLEMAIEWRKNGVTGQSRPRIGGAPGGPYNSADMGHDLPKRGAP